MVHYSKLNGRVIADKNIHSDGTVKTVSEFPEAMRQWMTDKNDELGLNPFNSLVHQHVKHGSGVGLRDMNHVILSSGMFARRAVNAYNVLIRKHHLIGILLL